MLADYSDLLFCGVYESACWVVYEVRLVVFECYECSSARGNFNPVFKLEALADFFVDGDNRIGDAFVRFLVSLSHVFFCRRVK